MSEPLRVPACARCAHAIWPPRLLCPRCGSAEWGSVEAGGGVVEELTQLADGEQSSHALGSVRLAAGPTAIVRCEEGVQPGDGVRLCLVNGALVARSEEQL